MIPRFAIQDATLAHSDWEAKGITLHVKWLGFVFEITFARVYRSFDR